MEDLTGRVALLRYIGSHRVAVVRIIEGSGEVVKVRELSEERKGRILDRDVHRNCLSFHDQKKVHP